MKARVAKVVAAPPPRKLVVPVGTGALQGVQSVPLPKVEKHGG